MGKAELQLGNHRMGKTTMPKFAANISLLFEERPYLERFEAAAAAGFSAVEILFPYTHPAEDTTRALAETDLHLVLINAPPIDTVGRAPGFAAIPGGEPQFEAEMHHVLTYVRALKPQFVHIMSGKAAGPEAEATFVRNLQWIADLVPDQTFTIEPLNPDDQPGYFLNTYPLAQTVLDQVDRPNVGLQYDAYHAQKIHGDARGIWEAFGPRAVHIQIGDTPDRRTPMTGEIDFPALFAAIDASGYSGWVSAEYFPNGTTEDTLAWMRFAQ